ncbi:hypothetical protein YWIDRAFT_03805 [Streptomyces sp. SceaMP-e96]|uniref:hypothetical protein n=1 Tax=unclassified Streptomyces TaxID=2593676 RepID=UPI000823F1FE|nr:MULTISPECIES: hypothetical protein [unclassified Streptomyces]SCK59709.1 hypothetical protein YWIDRAFT_03805 [Streptomyces sp. SceaMP-e96]
MDGVDHIERMGGVDGVDDRIEGGGGLAADGRTGETMPAPTPVTTRPGISAVQDEPAPIASMSTFPAPTASAPPPRVRCAGSRCSMLPATAEVAKKATGCTVMTRAVDSALSPAPSCSQREMTGSAPNPAR